MELILARHGNTFAPGDRVVWVGAADDLPLTAEGVQQAERLGEVLAQQRIELAAVYTGPLIRTREFARIALERAGISCVPQVDDRLNEIDYGAWRGLTNEEVRERFGSELDEWDRHGTWPSTSWNAEESAVIAGVDQFREMLTHGFHDRETVLVVSSNGVLRYFLRAIEGEFDARTAQRGLKMRTGHVGRLSIGPTLSQVRCWDVLPPDAWGSTGR